MKKIFMLSLIFVIALAANGLAVQYQGSIDNTETGGGLLIGGIFATWQWSDSFFELSWDVSSSGSGTSTQWTYEYTLFIDKLNASNLKELSHVIIEVSDTFTQNNIKEGTTPFGESGGLNSYSSTSEGNSNPGMPSALWGIKWNNLPDSDSANNTLTYLWTVVSDRAPMWGDFYAVDGKTPSKEVYAYNTGFGIETFATIGDGNAMDADYHAWLLVPDTVGAPPPAVPEPNTLLLIGAGLLGIRLLRRTVMKKNN